VFTWRLIALSLFKQGQMDDTTICHRPGTTRDWREQSCLSRVLVFFYS